MIAHALTAAGGAAISPLRAAFGDGFMTPEGALDRAAMRDAAFSDPAARKRLEAILHPMIRTEVEQSLAHIPNHPDAYGILVVPLLIETDAYREQLDRTLVIDCPVELQIARVMTRSKLTAEAISAIIAAQASPATRLARADDVIVNTRDLAALHRQVAALHAHYRRLAAEKHAART